MPAGIKRRPMSDVVRRLTEKRPRRTQLRRNTDELHIPLRNPDLPASFLTDTSSPETVGVIVPHTRSDGSGMPIDGEKREDLVVAESFLHIAVAVTP